MIACQFTLFHLVFFFQTNNALLATTEKIVKVSLFKLKELNFSQVACAKTTLGFKIC